jgi:hypothetical protein
MAKVISGSTAQRMGAFVVKDSTIVLNMLIKYKQEFSHNYFFFFFYSFLPRPRVASHAACAHLVLLVWQELAILPLLMKR